MKNRETSDTLSAIRELRAALALDPYDVAACVRLLCLVERAEPIEESVGVWCQYAAALSEHGQRPAAAWAYRQALARKPDCLRALISLGRLYHGLAEPKKASDCFEQALAIDPENAHVHIELGRARHHLGDIERGWLELAWSFRRAQPGGQSLEQPVWDGHADLVGRRVLVWEQFGLGDSILFLRYLPLLKQRGAHIIFLANRLLEELSLECFDGVDRFIAHLTPLPGFDTHVPLGLLPSLLTGREASATPVPTPYLHVESWRREEWCERLGRDGRFTIGLVWAGEPGRARRRSMPLSVYAPLSRLPNIRLVSLQFGPRAQEYRAAPDGLTIEPLLDPSCTIADTAAVILNLDLVLTVDTMVAHLAGALGAPVWTLLPRTPAWMWRRDTRRSVWYPTMELFRRTSEEWLPVLEEIADRLQAERQAPVARSGE